MRVFLREEAGRPRNAFSTAEADDGGEGFFGRAFRREGCWGDRALAATCVFAAGRKIQPYGEGRRGRRDSISQRSRGGTVVAEGPSGRTFGEPWLRVPGHDGP